MIFLKKMILKEIERRGYLILKVTPAEKIKSFLKKVYPKKTKSGLIRMGGESDGGYLIPNDLNGVSSCFSPGVSDISQFERECLDKGISVFMADYSVSEPKLDSKKYKYSFLKKFIGSYSNEKFISINQWISSNLLEKDGDLILQMDIEGSEYQSILNISEELLLKFRIIVIEFHHLESLWNPHFFQIFEATILRLLENHTCVHIHPNNSYGIEERFGMKIPRILEMTFYRNDRGITDQYVTNFPNPLDKDSISADTILLPKDWYFNN